MNKTDVFSLLLMNFLQVFMTLDQLQYFVATAQRQHIGQAATFLNISPSAISHSLAALEEEFGKALFEKSGRRIRLTPHGELLLERAEFLLSESERIREELTADQVKMRGHYRIAATHLLCSDYLTPAWMSIQQQHPCLTATLQSLRSTEIVTKVTTGEIDLGICFSPHTSPHHDQTVIHDGKLVFAFGKKHPFLKARRLSTINEYPSIAALAAQGIENCEAHPSFQQWGIKPKIINLYDNYNVAVEALRSNTVWTLLPDFIVHRHPDIESYSPRGWDATFQIAAVWPKHRVRTQTLSYVIEEVKKLFTNSP